MSYFWLFIYIIFVAIVITFFAWSTIILQRQKKTWHQFSEKHDLVYHKAPFMQASAVEGNYKNYRIGLFSEGKIDEQKRGMVRYRTVIEVIFGESMPCMGAFGSASASDVVQYLNFGTTFITPTGPDWDKNHIVTSTDHEFLKIYFTPERRKRLNSFLSMKGVVTMFVFDTNETFLRIETPNPLLEVPKIEKLIDKIIALGDVMKLTPEERKKFKPSKYTEQSETSVNVSEAPNEGTEQALSEEIEETNQK